MKNILTAIFAVALICTTWLAQTSPQNLSYVDNLFNGIEKTFVDAGNMVAGALLNKAITVSELKQKYNASGSGAKVRVLLVPGHEPYYGGTEYGNLKEREMNVELAKYLGEFLKNNGRYDVMMARDNEQWSPTIYNYFVSNWDSILTFFQQSKEQNLRNIATATSTRQRRTVQHNKARTDVAMRLYGINKWGNENGVDIAIHIHFNDYPRKRMGEPGVYTGFTVYVPEQDFDNSPTTQAVAKTIFNRLAKYNPVSNLPIEDEGIVESPDLIAIGAHNTSNAASMLVEYGYIYEPQFQDHVVRSKTLKDLAFQTYLGLQDFFGSGNDVSFAYDTLMLPYEWNKNVSPRNSTPEDVLALQSALLLDGLYPSPGRSKNDCPRTGKIGPCTLGAIQAFQKRYGISGEEGYVGEKTREILNGKYSVRAI